MGSLMAGWDSPPKDPNYVKLMRKKSVTKEGIEEYWKEKKKIEEEHLQAISSCSEPPTQPHDAHVNQSQNHMQDLVINNCWWERSNSAFLNEPPVIAAEVPTYKYASQHHVANITHSNTIPTN